MLSDERIEELILAGGGRWHDKSFWKIEDADLHPTARAIEAEVRKQDARQPLTDVALDLMCEQALFGRISMQQFARSIEAAHGIAAQEGDAA